MSGPSGQVLAGRYELGRLLGRGGVADVYEAQDRTLSRSVAVKLLRESAGDESGRERFIAEARILARLSHSGLVTVLDAGFGVDVDESQGIPAPERPFLVMELVDGQTLAQAIATQRLTLETAASVGIQVAEALAYVHAHDVVHRDVKPGNVLLGRDRVKLADFGVARLLDSARQTKTGHIIGTVAYLAPEQVTGQDVTGASDVYSLGLVLLEAITGRCEYPGPATEAAVARLQRPPEVPGELPSLWRTLLREATALDPVERPSAQALADALRDQPTGPIPVATERPTDEVTVPILAGASTRVLTGPLPPVPPPSGRGPSGPPPPLIDRAGDALARQPRAVSERLRALDPSQRGLLAALAALVLLLVIVAIAGNMGAGGAEPPSNTPPELVEPLEDLHNAVNGGG